VPGHFVKANVLGCWIKQNLPNSQIPFDKQSNPIWQTVKFHLRNKQNTSDGIVRPMVSIVAPRFEPINGCIHRDTYWGDGFHIVDSIFYIKRNFKFMMVYTSGADGRDRCRRSISSLFFFLGGGAGGGGSMELFAPARSGWPELSGGRDSSTTRVRHVGPCSSSRSSVQGKRLLAKVPLRRFSWKRFPCEGSIGSRSLARGTLGGGSCCPAFSALSILLIVVSVRICVSIGMSPTEDLLVSFFLWGGGLLNFLRAPRVLPGHGPSVGAEHPSG
jgi:hypothetical protein